MSAARLLHLALAPALCAGLMAASVPARADDKEVALRGKAEVCFACHGLAGNSKDPAVPSLAGQPKQFITTQLVMFREGNRANPVMNALAQPLTNADINDLGGYFSAQAAASPAIETKPDATTIQAGQELTARLNCVQCHGADLKGQQHIPRLAGQQVDYLRTQLKGFKAGTRFDMDGNMTAAAQALALGDIETVSVYLSSLH